MNIYRWIGRQPQQLAVYALQKHARLQPQEALIRIRFTYETIYAVHFNGKLKQVDGTWLPFTVVYTNGMSLIGRDDPYQQGLHPTDSHPLYSAIVAFRNALDEREREKAQTALQEEFGIASKLR